MDAISILRLFTPADAVAVGFSLTGAFVLQRLIESPTFRRPSVSQIMVHYRRDWMREMVTRQQTELRRRRLTWLAGGFAALGVAYVALLGVEMLQRGLAA